MTLKSKIKLFSLLVIVTTVIIIYKLNKNSSKFEPIKKNNIVQNDLFVKGENLFIKNCAGCHYVGMDKIMTAPALGGITKRRDKKWLYKYTRTSYKMFERGDSIAVKIRSEKEWGLMPLFPSLTNSQMDAIYYFVEQRYEMTKKGLPVKE